MVTIFEAIFVLICWFVDSVFDTRVLSSLVVDTTRFLHELMKSQVRLADVLGLCCSKNRSYCEFRSKKEAGRPFVGMAAITAFYLV
jgi:hypothetical protein